MWVRTKIVFETSGIEYTDPICDTSWEIFGGFNDKLNKHETRFSGVESKVDAVEKSITDEVWMNSIVTVTDENGNEVEKTLEDLIIKHTVDLNGITSEVKDVKTEVKKKADDSTVQTLTDRVAKVEQNASGFEQTVKETYATKGELTDTSSTLESKFSQKAGEITQSVTDLEGNVSEISTTVDGIGQRVTDAEGNISTLTETSEKFKTELTNAKGDISKIQQKADDIEISVWKKSDKYPTGIKYIRDWLNGSDVDNNNYFCEIKVIKETESNTDKANQSDNLAFGIIPTSDVQITNPSYYTDEKILSTECASIPASTDYHYLQIDLDEIVYDIDKIQVWHYYEDNRSFNHKLEVSKDGKEWTTLYDSDIQGTYPESKSGRTYYISDNAINKDGANLKIRIDGITGEVINNDGYKDSVKTIINQEADNILLKVQKTIKPDGRNLIIRNKETNNAIIQDTGNTEKYQNHNCVELIEIEPDRDYAFSKNNTSLETDDYFRYAWYDETKIYINDRSITTDNSFIRHSPINARFISVSYPSDSLPKLEYGSVITKWSPAPEDVQKNIDNINSKVASISNELQITEDGTSIIKTITESVDGINGQIETQKEWVHIDGSSLELGKDLSPFKTKLTESKLEFCENGTSVAWVSNNELHETWANIKSGLNVNELKLVYEGEMGYSFM